ncbi:restriction endonuclease subunit S [Porticoccaceae bacterium]|nr:restriction endonuclease subunit S [Porticoccaceae bacterium]
MSSVVPEGWYETELHQFVNVSRGYAFKSSDYRSSGNPIVRVTNITNSNKLDLTDNIVFLDESRTKEFESYLLKNDDFLLVMVGATVGKYAEVNTKGRLLFLNQNMWRLSVHDGTNSQRFAIYGLQKVVEEFLGTMQGSAREFLTQKDFGKAPVLLPPLPEQKKIASILTSVDEVIENTQKQIDKLQDLKKATMNELLTKGIGHTEFKDSELGRIPKSWEVVRFGEISPQKTLGTTERGGLTDKIPLIKMGDLKFGNVIVGANETVSKSKLIPNNFLSKGDFLFNTRNTPELVGKVGNFNSSQLAAYDNNLLKIDFTVDISSLFMGIQFNELNLKRRLRRIVSGTTSVAAIYWSDLKNFYVLKPSISEQKKIYAVFESIDKQIKTLESKLAQTQSLKKSLMQDLLTGKVRVTVN